MQRGICFATRIHSIMASYAPRWTSAKGLIRTIPTNDLTSRVDTFRYASFTVPFCTKRLLVHGDVDGALPSSGLLPTNKV